MNDQLSKLFLDLDLFSKPETMASKSYLKFNYIIRQGISWTGGNTSSFVANFDKNPVIKTNY